MTFSSLVGGPAVLGEWAYIFCLYGEPSASQPWGWQFFGHHLSLNCFVLGEQMVLTPSFWGAEPSSADHGPFAGIRLFEALKTDISPSPRGCRCDALSDPNQFDFFTHALRG